MEITNDYISLNENDLREIFSLFSSPTEFERTQVYDCNSEHYFANVSLSDEYLLNQEKREFALDAWRAVISFLNSQGYCVCKDGKRVTLSFIENEFIP